MGAKTRVREQTENLLEVADAMVVAAIGGDRDQLETLERQRAQLFEKVLATEELNEADRIFLLGALEHIRRTDQTVREFAGFERETLWSPPKPIHRTEASDFPFVA